MREVGRRNKDRTKMRACQFALDALAREAEKERQTDGREIKN